ncbi:MAG: hypothetical protein LBT23_09095 [Synergistaceae bacterium]|nr:hypothetical protein [Synergistaceae bacterium]
MTEDPYPLEESGDKSNLKVSKMTFGKKGGHPDKSVIVYNAHLKFSGVPLEAYDYIVNGKSALEWIMERYRVTVDSDSGIKNDPNDWSGDPRYIADLVKRVVLVSLETARIVKGLPGLEVLG